MKRNDKDKRWDIGSGYYCDGYQRHKMKHWHTNEEARATDKLYNHRHHNNGWGDPDWSRIDRTLKQFHGKSYAAFRAYMESHVGYLKDKTGWNWEDHVVDDKNSSVRWAFEEDGVLKYPRGVKEPKHPDGVIKLAPKGKDIRYRFNPKVKNMFPWLSGFITNNVGVLHGGCARLFENCMELTSEQYNELKNHLFWGWRNQVNNKLMSLGINLDASLRKDLGMGTHYWHYEDRPINDLDELMIIRDATKYIYLKKGSKECKRYFAELHKREAREFKRRMKAIREDTSWNEDITKDNVRQQAIKADERWSKTKDNIFLLSREL